MTLLRFGAPALAAIVAAVLSAVVAARTTGLTLFSHPTLRILLICQRFLTILLLFPTAALCRIWLRLPKVRLLKATINLKNNDTDKTSSLRSLLSSQHLL